MPLAGFEPTISAGERPQTYSLGRVATGTVTSASTWTKFSYLKNGSSMIFWNIRQNLYITQSKKPKDSSWFVKFTVQTKCHYYSTVNLRSQITISKVSFLYVFILKSHSRTVMWYRFYWLQSLIHHKSCLYVVIFMLIWGKHIQSSIISIFIHPANVFTLYVAFL
jgi:hypothetical protein